MYFPKDKLNSAQLSGQKRVLVPSRQMLRNQESPDRVVMPLYHTTVRLTDDLWEKQDSNGSALSSEYLRHHKINRKHKNSIFSLIKKGLLL